jgi:hypothetical protein
MAAKKKGIKSATKKGNGGDGLIRFLTFEPDGTTLSVRTFSTLHPAWREHPDWSFSLPLQQA